MTIGEGVYKIIKNCVTSFVDDRFVQTFALLYSVRSLPIERERVQQLEKMMEELERDEERKRLPGKR